MRPDISHVVITRGESNTIWFHCDPGYPNNWRKGDTGQLLNKLVHAGRKVIITVANKRMVFEKGFPPVHFYDKDPLSMEQANGTPRSK